MVKLTPLKPGDTIAIIAPGGWVEADQLERAVARAQAGGFNAFIHPQCNLRHGRFAGTDTERLNALHEVFTDPHVKAAWCVRGGYGAIRLLDQIDYDLIRRHPKPLIGLSDITALLVALYQRTGMVTFHGRMAGQTAQVLCPESERLLWSALQGQFYSPSGLPGYAPEIMVAGRASGKLLGGNLAMLSSLMGSRDQVRLNGAILFIEETNEPLYRLDRMLMQLSRAGREGLRGVIVGDITSPADVKDSKWSAASILHSHFAHLGIPVVTHYPAGHIPHQTVLPIGAEVELVAEGEVELKVTAPVFI